MKINFIILFVCITHMFVAQKQKIFVENIKDFTTKIDSFPFFVYQKEELDTLIALNRRMSKDTEQFGLKCEERVGFTVDRNNKIQNIKHYLTDIVLPRNIVFKDYSRYDTLKLSLQKESERLLHLTEGLWYSDSLREKKEIKIKIFFVSQMYESLNKDLEYVNNYTLNYGNHNSLLVKKELYNFGVKKFQSKKMHLAKVYFEQSIAYFPNDIDAHYNLASCYYKLKNTEKACIQWKTCLELGDVTVQEQILKYCK